MLEIDSIIELRISKKIEQAGLLIFDIDKEKNISARLHVSNLSNHSTLSNKMFALLNVGDRVIVFVKSYNSDKNYYELSTKVFRNSLDDVLPFNVCRNLIEEQFNKRNNQDPMFIIENRRTLDRLRGDLASTDLTLLYELLQNADDHPNSNFNNDVSVHFEIFNNYLLLKHNGSLFTIDNFRSISGIALGEQETHSNQNRIGYKGIGFKSVFRHSDNVYIRSGNFSFCFDKNKSPEGAPWEVLPIFENELDKIDEITQFDFFNSPVAFAFEFRSESEKMIVNKHLNDLFNNPYLIMFLKNIKKLKINSIFYKHIFEKEEVVDDKGRTMLNLLVDGKITSQWVKFSNTYILEDSEILSELSDINNKSIPDHFRNFTKPKIDVLVPVHQINNPINVFAYLPLTETKLNLNYIVNGDFIPNLDRSNILENLSYNLKLAYFTGIEVLNACESFALNYDFESLKKIFPIYEEENNLFKIKLQEAFIKNVSLKKLFPNYYDKYVCDFENTILDATKIYKVFSKDEYNEIINIKGKPLDLRYFLSKEYKFIYKKNGKGKVFQKSDLILRIKDILFQNWLKNPINCNKLIKHFESVENLYELLETESVFINSNKELVSIDMLYKSVPSDIQFLGVNVINSTLLELINEENLDIISKLHDFEPVEFYNKHIVGKEHKINDLLFTDNNVIKFWRFIFQYWHIFQEESEITNSLKAINVLCKSKEKDKINLNRVSKTYLANEYDIVSEVESVFINMGFESLNFISDQFITDNYPPEKWRLIFEKLGAITNFQSVISAIIPILTSIDEQKHFGIGKQIFDYWKNNKNQEGQITSNSLKLLSENLKIKCINGTLLIAKNCIIADHYTTNTIIDDTLSVLRLPNQISIEYDSKRNDILEWNIFFKEIGCKSLSEKTSVIDEKIKYLIENQEKLRDNHTEIIQSLSHFFGNSNFQLNGLSELILQTNKDTWALPNQIHFSSDYEPKLNLQVYEDFSKEFLFLSKRYDRDLVSYDFLKHLGVQDNFRFDVKSNISFNDYDNIAFKTKLTNSKRFKDELNLHMRRFSSNSFQNQCKFDNQVLCYPKLSASIVQRFNNIFFESVFNLDEKYFKQTMIVNGKVIYASCDNELISFIKGYETIENRAGIFKKPSDLISLKYSKHISDDGLFPSSDIFKELLNSGYYFDEIVGIQQLIPPKMCIQLFNVNRKNKISFDEIYSLKIVESLKNYVLNEEERKDIYLFNENEEWKPIRDLLYVDDNQLKIDWSFKLNKCFNDIAKNFGFRKLTYKDLVLRTTPLTPENNSSILEFFSVKLKFIAFKIDRLNYKNIEVKILHELKRYKFFKVVSISQIIPDLNFTYKNGLTFYKDGFDVYYTDNWKNNSDLVNFLYSLVPKDKIEMVWFNNVINTWDENKLKEFLEGEYGVLPNDLGEKAVSTKKSTENSFLNEVTEFIAELEETEWKNYTPELKNLINNYSSQPIEKQKLYNLIAKIKLTKSKGIEYEEIGEGFNVVKIGDEMFFVHSARGAFAYIHPYEILKMKEEGYKMALDFSSNLPIKIYDKAEEILQLNKTHILVYQNEKTMDELLNFCELNRDANKRLLVVDKVHSGERAKDLLKLLNIDDD